MEAPRYLEPRTDCPARQDWSTALVLSESRSVGRMLSPVLVLLPIAVGLAVVLPATTANVVSVGVLVLLGLLGAFGPLVLLIELRPRRQRLLDQPWCRRPTTLAATGQPGELERVIVSMDGRPVVLRGAMGQVPELLLHRQEVFVVGPDADGHALVRVAGLCQPFPAKLDTGEARPRERSPAAPGCPPDPRALRRLRRGARGWIYPAAVGVAGLLVLLAGLRPLSPLALVVGGVLLVVVAVAAQPAVVLSRHYAAAAAAAAATGWTSAPVTLFPWEPTNVVSGLATLPGGSALIQFPLPNLDVIANIADTGTVWIWGSPTGVVAVGAPRLPVLTVAVLEPDRDVPPDEPQPWMLRANDPGLSGIPALRR